MPHHEIFLVRHKEHQMLLKLLLSVDDHFDNCGVKFIPCASIVQISLKKSTVNVFHGEIPGKSHSFMEDN